MRNACQFIGLNRRLPLESIVIENLFMFQYRRSELWREVRQIKKIYRRQMEEAAAPVSFFFFFFFFLRLHCSHFLKAIKAHQIFLQPDDRRKRCN